jgi:hypothetical protein
VIERSADADRIERDLEHTRARLDATLDALQRKLSPGQMVDETMHWFKEGGGAEFGRNLGRNLRDNPLPVALIGIGVGWLMLSGGRRQQRFPEWEGDAYERTGATTYGTGAYGGLATPGGTHQPMPYEAAAYEDLARKAEDAGAGVQREAGESDDAFHERVYAAKGAVVGVTRQAGETFATFKDRVEAAVEAAADRFRRMRHDVAAAAGAAGSRAGELASGAARQGQARLRSVYGYGQSAAYSVREGVDYATWRAREMGGRTAEYLKEQPLLMGVLGVAVGAVLGMLVPPTRHERELAGDLRRGLGEQARAAATDVSQRVSRVAESVLDTAHDAAQREGLTGMSPSRVAADAREQIADAAGRVRTVVEESATAGQEALKRETAPPESRADRQGGDGGSRPVV